MSRDEAINIAYQDYKKGGTLVLREGAEALRSKPENGRGDYWLVVLKIDVIPADEYTVMTRVYDDGTIAGWGV